MKPPADHFILRKLTNHLRCETRGIDGEGIYLRGPFATMSTCVVRGAWCTGLPFRAGSNPHLFILFCHSGLVSTGSASADRPGGRIKNRAVVSESRSMSP